MKRLSKLFTIFIFSVIMLTVGGCQDFLDVNESKDNPIDPPISERMPLIVFMMSQETYDHAEYGIYLSQCLTTGGKVSTNWAYKNAWNFLNMNRHPQWRRHFYDIGVNVEGLLERANNENARNATLIMRTILLYSTLITTDVFGDMPRSEVYKSASPAYDTQESIYEWMFGEADELLQLYNDESWTKNPDNITITPTMDRIFSGDLAKWNVFAKAIKARLLLRKLPNWDNTPATCDAIIAAVDATLNDPNYTDVIYKYDGGSPAEKCCPWGPAQPKMNLGWAQARDNLLDQALPSKFFFYGMLGGYTKENVYVATRGYALDPRATKLMNPVIGQPMRYLENNIGMDVTDKITNYPGLFSSNNPYTKNDGYILLFGREELLFIKAEAQYWKGDKIGSYATYIEAVDANLQRFNAIPDNNASAIDQRNYERFRTIRFTGESEYTIAELMQQKYIAMYMLPEQWTDMRRYNYSSRTNGIRYDGEFVYTIKYCYNGGTTQQPNASNFTTEFSLTRPYNLYAPYWDTPDSYGINAHFSPNAWINRLNYDPETEERYNSQQLELMGAYQNPQWLRKRMIWAYKNNNYVECADPTEWQ